MSGPDTVSAACDVCVATGELFGATAVGGGERQIALLAEGLSKHGHTLHLVARRMAGVDGGSAWPYGPSRWYEGVVARRERWIGPVRQAVRETPADVVYQRGASAVTVGAGLGAADRGAGFVWAGSSDADADGVLRRFVRALAQRRIATKGVSAPRLVTASAADAVLQARALRRMRRADVVIAQSEAQAVALRRTLGARADIVVVPSIAAVARDQAEGRRDLVLWVGADKAVKRPWLFEEIVRSAPLSLRYLMAGLELEPRPGEPGVAPEVRGALSHAEVLDLVSRALVVVNTSEVEGFSNVFLEAWSLGVPMLTLGADPDGAVTRGPAGWVCETVSDAAAVLSGLAEDASEASVRGARGAAYVAERHSAAPVIERTSAILGKAAAAAVARRTATRGARP